MVQLELYESLGLPQPTIDSVMAEFNRSVLGSNRSFDFFVGWGKVDENVQQAEADLRELDSLRGRPNLPVALAELLGRRPSVARLLPLLIAWRETRGNVLTEDPSGEFRLIAYQFDQTSSLTQAEATKLVEFCQKTGFLERLPEIADLMSYYRGVEVGMDTNARKNRSGKFMEDRVAPILSDIAQKNPTWQFVPQQSFRRLQEMHIDIPPAYSDRKPDFVMLGPSARKVNIEVNFYDKLGSKPQEIVDSYIRRAESLKEAKWEFVWITDGPAWKMGTNQLRIAFNELNAVLNLSFCRRGVLHRIFGDQVTHSARLGA